MALLQALAATLLIASQAQAGDYGFKGISLGSHVSQVATNPKYDCKAVTTPTAGCSSDAVTLRISSSGRSYRRRPYRDPVQ